MQNTNIDCDIIFLGLAQNCENTYHIFLKIIKPKKKCESFCRRKWFK